MVVCFDAILQTAVAVSRARKADDVGKTAAAFLHWLTDEAALQLGMIADASDQVMLLIRSNDVDQPDPATMAAFVNSFLMEGSRLWLEGHCWGFGCTASMLRFLKHPRTYLIAGGQKGICTLGGSVDEACKRRCIERMVCWFRLVFDVCHAEWPYFDILNATQVFNVAPMDGHQPAASSDTAQSLQSQSLERLANTFGCQPDMLEAQFMRHRPVAQAAYSASTGSNLKAWRDAIDKTQKAGRRGSQGWLSDELRKILMHYGSCCASTSALERRFSKMEKIWGTRVCNQTTMQLRDTLELFEPLTDAEMRETAEVVRDVWRLYYPAGCCKPNTATRIDKGTKRRAVLTGLAEFNRKRHRANLRSTVPGVANTRDAQFLADQQIQAAGSWTPAMQKEHDFQMKKIVRGAGEAYMTGGVLNSERRWFKKVFQEHKAKRALATHQRHLAESRKMLAILPPKPLDFSLGGRVFIEPGCIDGFDTGSVTDSDVDAAVSQVIHQNHMLRVDDSIDAAGGYIVVANPNDVGHANRWIAVLAGGALVTPDYFAKEGKSGSCLCWHAAVQVKRDVWISAEWERQEPLLASLLKWAIRLPASKWRLREEWNSATYVQKKQKTLIGMITVRQKALRAFQRLPHAFAADQFLEFVAKLDPSVLSCQLD